MVKLPFLDANDVVFRVTLEGTQYKIRMLWNALGGFWTLSLYTTENVSLLEGVKAAPLYPLLKSYHKAGIPPGELRIVTLDNKLQMPGRTSFADGKASLTYMTEAEINAV